MTQEEKNLLLKDLWARLPLLGCGPHYIKDHPEKVKSYIHPLSSMTKKELEELTDEELDEVIYLSKQLKELTAEMKEVSKCICSKLDLGLINNSFKEDIKKFQDLNENIYKIHEKNYILGIYSQNFFDEQLEWHEKGVQQIERLKRIASDN